MSVKFGVHIAAQFGYDYDTVRQIAVQAESLGYNLLTIGDHLFLDENSAERDCLEAWMLLSALGAQTSKIRLSPLVTANSFRNPALLAKMAATVDVVTNGRLTYGIGAGWKKLEYDAYGYEFPSARTRLEQLEEAVQIAKLMWTEEQTSFKGKHYTIKEAFCAPKPIQKPHPPIMVGGHGKKFTLRIVAKYADMCNFTFQVGSELDLLLDALQSHCRDVGRDYNTIEKTLFTYCAIFEEEQEYEKFVEEFAKRQDSTPEKVKERQKEMPGAWIGTPDLVARKCEFLVEKGFTTFPIRFLFEKDLTMMKLFHKQVASRY
jgi:F420-dependent oxidoreductase-like protein